MTDIINKKVGVISLGCDKNRVDTEKMLAKISEKHKITNDLEEADVIIINTCAFLKSAREEAIEEILYAGALKMQEGAKKIIVTGCLPQRFIKEIFNELTEVDAFLGISDYHKINDVIDEIFKGQRLNAVGNSFDGRLTQRVRTTNHYAYLKIADGCSNHCTYCLIPSIRGKYRSVKKEDLLEEVNSLGKIDELILVAQDITKYGRDLVPETSLVELIKKISALDSVNSIRLLYCYPENVDDKLIEEFKSNPKLIKYIDIPFQHADDKVLKLMNRPLSGEKYLELINKLKSEVEGIAIRSTFITGFPGEGEEEFNNLLAFLEKARLFNAGFFKYSKEEGTPAYKLSGHLPESVKSKRLKKLYAFQKKIVKSNFKSLINKTIKVKAEGFDKDRLVYYGRAYFNAPDIDGKVYFFSNREVDYGNYYDIKIIEGSDYDLLGEMV